MLQNDFIPAAVDGGMTRRRKDPEGAFYLKFADTQARYVAAADGTSLAKKTWAPSPHLNQWMKDALARFDNAGALRCKLVTGEGAERFCGLVEGAAL